MIVGFLTVVILAATFAAAATIWSRTGQERSAQ